MVSGTPHVGNRVSLAASAGATVVRYSTLQCDVISAPETYFRTETAEVTAKKLTLVLKGTSIGGELTITVLKNGVATALTITSGVAGTHTITADVDFSDGDGLTIYHKNDNSGQETGTQTFLYWIEVDFLE